jgi:uncharacterized membrane protein
MSREEHRVSLRSSKYSHGIERIAFFSDAVFAIAITLLVLDLTLPPHTTNSNVSHQLTTALWSKYGAFAFTFLLIGLRWLTHLIQFRYICRYDDWLLALNLLLLFAVAFLPFASRVLSEYPNSRAVSVLYAGTMFVAGSSSTALWVYAGWKGRLVDNRISDSDYQRLFWRWVSLPILFGVAIILAITVDDLRWARGFAIATVFAQVLIAVLWPIQDSN